MKERYFLSVYLGDELVKREVTREQWVVAERRAGFRVNGVDRGQPATGGFTGQGSISGSIEYEKE